MRAMILQQQKQPLILKEVSTPNAAAHELLIKVHACGIRRTD